jgi:hypothetical protein
MNLSNAQEVHLEEISALHLKKIVFHVPQVNTVHSKGFQRQMVSAILVTTAKEVHLSLILQTV